jgi:ubiquitin carboxyl-terminal hydrolase 34
VISDFYCEQCQNRGETTKRNIISEIPNIFFVHLRRIVFNYDMFLNMKIHTRLQFPEDLNMEPFTKEGVELRESKGLEYMKKLKHDEEEAKKFEELTLHGKDKDHYKMKLKGVIVHSGSADVGHYYSILPNPTNSGWLKFDDSRTTIFTSSDFDS